MWRQRARSAGAAVRTRVQQQHMAVGRWLSTTPAENSAMLRLLQQVAAGEVSPASAVEQCRRLEYEDVGGYAKIDTNRFKRTGFPEVVYAEGKTPEQVAQIMELMVAKGVDTNVMATRVTPLSVEEILVKVAPDHKYVYYPTARILASKDLNGSQGEGKKALRKGIACILCAGTSDLPVAEEAAITLELAGYEVKRLYDVGVAGIHRLLRNQHVLHESDVAICVAGMDGALPGVVGGLTEIPVVAVPTSVGYGAAFSGLAPLLTMLNACSPGVGVVNIDNGFGAAVLAGK
uniref:phosphoribosylaminoimidazole carboxylase n=1 Tax=Globisporangium ultimum (strain ATCC 200006 / CBS 805.95 / DAOM BR144) TaxID=431595 RepID=K3WGX4_GLOUD